jgi:selenide,water dikinase
VYIWESGPALVQTVDFFTPVVDDPREYGAIAAANSMSDVYAMGGRPLTAVAVAAFPQGMDAQVMRDVFTGGLGKLREAGVSLLGGHTVRDNEIKFGYAITGAIDRDRILRNSSAKPGDALFLTKPIGTGVIATAIKYDRADPQVVANAVRSMSALNEAAARSLADLHPAVHACTDVTGFGLIGHASEMAAASGVTIVLEAEAVPLLPGARELVADNRAGGMKTNQLYFPAVMASRRPVDEELGWLLYDPQTSGGLLAAVDGDKVQDAAAAFARHDVHAVCIGHVEQDDGTRIYLV